MVDIYYADTTTTTVFINQQLLVNADWLYWYLGTRKRRVNGRKRCKNDIKRRKVVPFSVGLNDDETNIEMIGVSDILRRVFLYKRSIYEYKTYWRCVNYLRDNCHSRLHTCIITNGVIKPPSERTCKTDGSSLEIRKFNEELVHWARNTQEMPDIIVTTCYKALSDQGIVRLPIRDNIKRRIRMVRKKKNIVNAPNDPNFTTIPTSLTKTVRDDMFLRCDTGPGTSFTALGHQNKYESDPEFSHNIHKIAALAFLKPDDVVKVFEDLSMNLDDEYQTVLDYFEETYISRLRANHTRRKPMFTIDFWSMFHRTTQSLMRTNNSAEAYHHRINSIFQCSHSTLWVFLQKLIDGQNATHAVIVHIRSEQVPKSKKKNESFEK
ncbi:unnamed protein product [Rotaria magnacalcarata]|uniref:Uncharacterized protein n=1 Tax=Rotaria magnacalcarata TaxID=392030 RepID=A0A816VIX4_9BILA|nr:unnamed protein product [Rotaria magnacalcarata]